jgi:hypothetical protein
MRDNSEVQTIPCFITDILMYLTSHHTPLHALSSTNHLRRTHHQIPTFHKSNKAFVYRILPLSPEIIRSYLQSPAKHEVSLRTSSDSQIITLHNINTAAMPPKRKPSSSSPPSILITSPTTPTSAELASGLLPKYTMTTDMDSSPLLAKSKQIETQTPAIEEEEETPEENETHVAGPDAADDSGTEQTSAKQGTAEKKSQKKTPALKRKATPTTDDTPEPAAKKQKAPPKKRAAPEKPAAAPKKRTKKGEEDATWEPRPPPPPPLPLVIKRKINTIHDFFDTHPKRLLESEAGSYVVEVDELDLLAALVILRVDYELVYTVVVDVSFGDAAEMIVDRMEAGKISVDFNKRCDIERAAQATFAGRQTGLETVNLLEVEIDMLVARRQQLAEDEMPAAGFRVYEDESVDDGADDHEEVIEEDAADDVLAEEDAAEGDGLPAKPTIEERQVEARVSEDVDDEEDVTQEGVVQEDAGDEDAGEEDAVEEDAVEEDAVEEDSIEAEILDAVANEEESVHENEAEAVDEQNDDDEAEEESEEE